MPAGERGFELPIRQKAGADVGPSVERGVAGLGLDHDTSRYFDIHHTAADTFEKVVKTDMNHNIAIMAVMAYVLADMPERLVEPDALAPAPARGRHAAVPKGRRTSFPR